MTVPQQIGEAVCVVRVEMGDKDSVDLLALMKMVSDCLFHNVDIGG